MTPPGFLSLRSQSGGLFVGVCLQVFDRLQFLHAPLEDLLESVESFRLFAEQFEEDHVVVAAFGAEDVVFLRWEFAAGFAYHFGQTEHCVWGRFEV